ncbi:hypothetical protein OAS43_01630 [Candidatus Pelagibacter sp.]|nr:hypothetical protein [Candidatus Pelagibacter sp.]
MITSYFVSIIRKIFQEHYDKKLILNAKKISLLNLKKNKIKELSEIEFQVFSQWGEDGIIDWLINKFSPIPKIFVEIGTEDYSESNTRFLLINKNWKGFLIEANKKDVEKIKKQRIYWKHDLKIQNSFINADNVNDVIRNMNIPKDIGLLSIDIDSIDYWVLKKLNALSPAIIICEYNSLFGIKKPLTIPYKKKFLRSEEHYSNLYFGASIKAFENLMKKKGYFLIGTNSAGNNAFFMKNKYLIKANKMIMKKTIYKSKFRESRDNKGNLSFLDKKESLNLIRNKSLIDLKDNYKKKIDKLDLLN